jgi:hypothetical protein
MLMIPIFCVTKILPSGAHATEVPSSPIASLSSAKPSGNVLPNKELEKSKQINIEENRKCGIEGAFISEGI